MKSNKGSSNLEDEDEYEEDFSAKKEATSSHKDLKNNDKASAIRSKHSVTEQRRRSKINERYQILRDLIPSGDQKRDTASFLLEVIEYVQLLQEKVQKYEGSYQGWSAEPTKLMPWRHSHWRVQNMLGHPQAIKNGPGPGTTFPSQLDEKGVSVAANSHISVDPDCSQDAYRAMDVQSEIAEKRAAAPASLQVHVPAQNQCDGDLAYLAQVPASDAPSASSTFRTDNLPEEHTVEGGTISISSGYSHDGRLLTTLTQALQNSGVDLSQASISIRIDVGKRANRNQASGTSYPKELESPISNDLKMARTGDGSSGGGEDSNQALKRLKK